MTQISKQLVLVHGFLGSALNWGPIIFKLSKNDRLKDWNMIAVDLLGHGNRPLKNISSKLDLKLTVDDFQTQLPEPPFVGLGHSFGLRPLLSYAAQFPEKVPALIVEDAGPSLSEYGYNFLKHLLTTTPDQFESRELAKEFFNSHYGSGSAMARFLLSQIRVQDHGKHSWRFDPKQLLYLLEESYQKPLWKEWETYPGQIYLIIGSESNFMTRDRVQECIQVRGEKPLELIQIDHSAHWVHSEQPDLFVQKVTEILVNLSS